MIDPRRSARTIDNVLRTEDVDDMVSIYGGAILANQIGLRLNRQRSVVGGERTNVQDIETTADGNAIDADSVAWVFPEADGATGDETRVRKIVITATEPVWVAVYGVDDYLGYVQGTESEPAWVDAASFEEQAYEEFGRRAFTNATNGQVRRYIRYGSGTGSVNTTIVCGEDVKCVVVSPEEGNTADSVVVMGILSR